MSEQNKTRVIYCGHDCQEKDGDSILEQLGYSHSSVDLQYMDFNRQMRLWDQILDKVSELNLSGWDACLFVVSRETLSGEAYLKETDYALENARQYPRGQLPCIGLLYL